MIYLSLFWEFFKTGLFATGGGMATLPFLYRMSETKGWFTAAQLADMVAVSESTPGPIGVNMATYVGFTTAGIPGSLIATVGLITPSIIVILIIARILQKFRSNKTVDAAFYGLRPCSVGLIAAAGLLVVKIALFTLDRFADIPAVKSAFAGIRVCVCVLIFNSVLKLYKSAVIDKAALVIFAAVLVCSFFFKVSPVILVVISAVLGILLAKWGVRGK